MRRQTTCREFYVYLMTNNSETLYVGMTNDLERRVWEHKNKAIEGFTSRYNLTKLVYFEATDNPTSALEREKRIKVWRRSKKITLIESVNPKWLDLSDGWFTEHPNGKDSSAVLPVISASSG